MVAVEKLSYLAGNCCDSLEFVLRSPFVHGADTFQLVTEYALTRTQSISEGTSPWSWLYDHSQETSGHRENRLCCYKKQGAPKASDNLALPRTSFGETETAPRAVLLALCCALGCLQKVLPTESNHRGGKGEMTDALWVPHRTGQAPNGKKIIRKAGSCRRNRMVAGPMKKERLLSEQTLHKLLSPVLLGSSDAPPRVARHLDDLCLPVLRGQSDSGDSAAPGCLE